MPRVLPRRRRALAFLLVPLAVAVAVSQPAESAPRKAVAHGANGAPSKAKVTAEPRLYHLKHGAGEPTLGWTRKGGIFVTASDGCVTSCAGSTETISTVAPGGRMIYASFDKGSSWQDRTPGAAGVSPHAISMDPYIYVDHTPDGDRIFNIDLYVGCSILSFSDDNGASWITNPFACGEPVNDHQTLFGGKPVSSPTIGYPHVLYYCFNHPAITKCSKSLDGGITFVPTTQVTAPECGGLNGHGVVDAKGVVYLPLASCGRPMLAISKDEGNTWNVIRTSELDADSGGDPSVAVDANGNLYYLFVDAEDRMPFLTISRNGGKSWSKPINVAPRSVKATNLATLTVGKPGSIAVAYYGSTMPEDGADRRWSGYLASGVNVLTGKPTFYTAAVNGPSDILKIGACRGRCGRVLDFIDVEIDLAGQPWAVFVDACSTGCEKTGKESIADNEGLVGTLVRGPKLR
ncbi:MAG TPA: sialidase family protein [Frankiaceae bacterium]|jgi:hypothetical protein|nr:sialidase family protein [Frankiaceae bacterium]